MRFRPFFRYLALVASALTLAFPARSADPDKDYRTTLSNLLLELRQSYATALESDSLLVNNPVRREQFAEMLHSADEVTIMLYTQRPELTFDMAFALENVERIHNSLQEQTRLSDKYRIAARSGLLRYTLLNETLQEMYRTQPVDSLAPADSLRAQKPLHAFLDDEDPERKALLDSCVHYTGALAALYGESVTMAMQDSVRIAETWCLTGRQRALPAGARPRPLLKLMAWAAMKASMKAAMRIPGITVAAVRPARAS